MSDDTAAERDTPRPARREPPRSAERGAIVSRRPWWPFGRLADGPGLPARVIERLCCDARVRLVLRGRDGSPLDLGHSKRVVTDRQFRALLIRDHSTCTYPGCLTRTGLQAHHVVHWLYGGRTDINNLLLLCQAHHHAHHDGRFTITRGSDGAFRFHRSGRRLDVTDRPGVTAAAIAGTAEQHRGVPLDRDVHLLPAERLDRSYVISVLAEARSGSTATSWGAATADRTGNDDNNRLIADHW